MQLVKVHELPSIDYNQIKDTDICIIENTQDTYNITIADLKLIFSNDTKIQSFYNSLLKMITILTESFTQSNAASSQTMTAIMNKVELMEENLSSMDGRIVALEGSVETMSNTLNQLVSDLSNLTSRVSNNEIEIANHSKKIKDIESDIDVHLQAIFNLRQKDSQMEDQLDELSKKIQALSGTVDSINAVSIETINRIKKEIMLDVSNKYDEIMEILDDKFHQTPIICDEN